MILLIQRQLVDQAVSINNDGGRRYVMLREWDSNWWPNDDECYNGLSIGNAGVD